VAPLRVLVVGEDPLARGGLVALLSARGELTVVGEVVPEDAAGSIRAMSPDVVLWDLGLAPGPDTDALTDALEGTGPAVVALVGGDGQAPDLLGAGAAGVLGRNADAGRLVAALQAAQQGLVVVEAALADGTLRTRVPAAGTLVEPLTPREREVLHLLGQGSSNRVIANRLGISEHTAKFHVNAILGKLGAHSRAEAVAQGVRMGVLLL
jgi:two-component system nitrate/nitrite response regulator NarL